MFGDLWRCAAAAVASQLPAFTPAIRTARHLQPCPRRDLKMGWLCWVKPAPMQREAVHIFLTSRAKRNPPSIRIEGSGKAPGDDLLSHGLSHTTIGAAAFHFRVRDGIGWFHSANFTRETVGASPVGAFRQTCAQASANIC